MVVQQEANPGLGGIAGVQFSQQSDEVRAGVVIADNLGYTPGMQIQTSGATGKAGLNNL